MSEETAKTRKKIKESFLKCKRKYDESCQWKGFVDAKLNGSAPFNFFLTKIKDSIPTHDEDLTISFPELLDDSLGMLEHSVHINFMVDLPWLSAQYAVNGMFNPSMTILYGVDDDDLQEIPSHLKVTAVRVKSPYPFGHHHTKMSIFFYSDKSIRFAVYTANLIESDWENRTQGIWLSPKCPYLGDDVPINYGESETYFKVDVLKYLNSYRRPELVKWLKIIQRSDCSSISVCFVASIPGEDRSNFFGHRKLSKLIKENCSTLDTESWDLVAQCSSIGSLGVKSDSWLLGEFSNSLLEKSKNPSEVSMSVIYPSVSNVKESHDGILGGACLPYSSFTHKRQLWLTDHLKQWKSDHRHRSKAVPHIKSYAKISSDGKKINWFLLTSANLSKAAWGKTNKTGALQILSYEAGVLFLPKFLIGKEVFFTKKGGNLSENKEEFPLPYDSPLTPYDRTDEIFLYDKCFRA